MTKRTKLLNKLILATGPFYEALVDSTLTYQERRAAAATLYRNAGRFVHRIVLILSEHKAIFRDIPIDPAELEEQQQQAECLRELQIHFENLARQAGDAYLAKQAEILALANGAYRRVKMEQKVPFYKDQDRLARTVAMGMADEMAPNRHGVPGKGRRGPSAASVARREAARQK